MPPVCSCGAILPEDARFCHRCGKPQREEVASIEPEVVPGPILPLSPAPPSSSQEVAFSNPLVLRTALLVASAASILEITPFGGFFAPIVGGFAAVSLYQFRSGHALTPRSGAKMGWITSILNALFITVFMTFKFAIVGASLFDPLRENLRQQAAGPAQAEALRMMNDGRFLALIVLMLWLILFAMSSLLYVAGGALAARMHRQKVS